jgi:hypothetical protein
MSKAKELLKKMGETRVSFTGDIINAMTKLPELEKRISSWYVANGTVGLFRSSDGNAYEIKVSPAKLGDNKDLFKKFLKGKK